MFPCPAWWPSRDIDRPALLSLHLRPICVDTAHSEREAMDRAHTPAWRNFKRMQDCACVVACLIYAGAVVHAWRVLPGPSQKKLLFTLAAPLIFLTLTILLPMVMGRLRRSRGRLFW